MKQLSFQLRDYVRSITTISGKRVCRIFVFLLSSIWTVETLAQNTGQQPVVSLDEVEVKAARIIKKTDGLWVYPSEEQKSASDTGYGILQKLALPNIRIDDVDGSVSAIDNRGNVQLRINGVVVGKAEMLALDPKNIEKVEFLDNPGVRYDDGTAYVIDIRMRRASGGYTIGTRLAQSLTAKNGDASLYGKWNIGKSEFSLNYGFAYKDFDGNRMEETARYHLNDGSLYTIRRNDIASRSRSFSNDVKLAYNLADSVNYQFQVSLSGGFSHIPGNFNRKSIVDGTSEYEATRESSSLSSSPVVDLYYFRRLSSNQSVTFNAVGTYIDTDSREGYDEGSAYRYDVDGRTGSLMSEAVYENRLKPFTFSAGFNHKYKYVRNEYTGDLAALNPIHNNRLYVFSEIKGFWRQWRYSVGLGMSYTHYRQQEHTYRYWAFCPKLSLSYDLTNEWQLSYDFRSNDRMSRIAMIGDAAIRTNRMEWTVGSPDLKPVRDLYNSVRLSYTQSRFQAFVEGFYKMCHRPNMAVYERTADDRFIYTQRNQKEIDALQAMGYVNYWLVPQKLSVSCNGGLFRCFNFGYDYTHCYTSYFVVGSVNAYIGKLSLSAYADNGWRFLEGETKGYSGAFASLQASYQHKEWQLSLTWQQPLMGRYKVSESEVLNRNLNKKVTLYSTDVCNLVSLTVSWRLNKGRKYHAADKTIHLKDNETGILQ